MANQSSLISFKVNGEIELDGGSPQWRREIYPEVELELVDSLNEHADDIAKDIEQQIQRSLSTAVNLESEIYFYHGSIDFEVIIYVLDWMARIADSVDFITMLTPYVQLVIGRVLRNWLRKHGPSQSMRPIIQMDVTTDIVKSSTTKTAVGHMSPMYISVDHLLRIIVLFVALDTILLGFVIVLYLVSPSK